jgi:3-deoxy-manno-octulosonate cytidylyltransferase (CMP-KDO synthetase)
VNPLIVIPSRLAAVRLPDKPLVDIHGDPMIVHVWRRAVASAVGPVVVAAADQAIVDAIRQRSGSAILTDPALPSGSDRVHAAAEAVDPDRDFDVVINLQGDLPTIDPTILRRVLDPLDDPDVDIATLAAEIDDEHERIDPNVVKAVIELPEGARSGRAIYFSRLPVPSGDGPHYHHLGIYAYRRAALSRFVALRQSTLERTERLEQLRALANGMVIACGVVATVPFGVDTPADLARARAFMARPN